MEMVLYKFQLLLFCYYIAEPGTMEEAMTSEQAAQWKAAADAEIQSLEDNETWDLVKLPPGRNPLDASGYSKSNMMSLVNWSAINVGWWQRDIFRAMG